MRACIAFARNSSNYGQ